MHTNYLDYARREDHGNIKELLLRCVSLSRTCSCGEGMKGGRARWLLLLKSLGAMVHQAARIYINK
jgi:hypothetical protein